MIFTPLSIIHTQDLKITVHHTLQNITKITVPEGTIDCHYDKTEQHLVVAKLYRERETKVEGM